MKTAKVWAENTVMAGRIYRTAAQDDREETDDAIELDENTARRWAAVTATDSHTAFKRRAGRAALAEMEVTP